MNALPSVGHRSRLSWNSARCDPEQSILAAVLQRDPVARNAALLGKASGKTCLVQIQDGDLDGFLKAQGGRPLSEDEIMHKFVQICLSVHYVHSKVRTAHLQSAS